MEGKFSDRMQEETKATFLDAVRTLKRATGIGDNPKCPDAFCGMTMDINVLSAEEAKKIHGLFSKFFEGVRKGTSHKWQLTQDHYDNEVFGEGYAIKFRLPDSDLAKKRVLEQLDKYIESLRQPDNRPGRSL